MDLRVKKTRENIEEHFLQLLEKYPFQEISVKQLILECRINRSTFFRNYEDKYDLIQKIAQEILEQFRRALRPEFLFLPSSKQRQLEEMLTPLLDFFQKEGAVLQVLKRRELPIDLFGDMHREFSKQILQELEKKYCLDHERKLVASYFADVISANILAAIQWWHDQCPHMSRERILSLISTTVIKGIAPSLQEKL